MLDETFLESNSSAFEDFWNRRVGDSLYELRYPAYGYTIHFQTNHRAVLDAARISAARYCHAQILDGSPVIEFRVMVVPTLPDSPVPKNLMAMLQIVGIGDCLYQAATPWIQWVTDTKARTCTMIISPALAVEPWQMSRSILDRATLNILVREGVAQLHATTLARDDCAILFIAPHGTGKSTTAFHLLNVGFRLMGDGLSFVRETRAGQFELMGYPVGEAKLTEAAKPLFPDWQGEGIEVTAHNVVKHVVNLRKLAPHKMLEDSVIPKRILLCLAERNGQPRTSAERLNANRAFARVLPDTIFWDEPAAMLRSLNVTKRLIAHSSCYHLTLGADREQLVDAIVGLVNQD